jgi:single-stranded-DNA-specific exonuclease
MGNAQMLNSMNAERKQIEQDMQEVALIQLELYGSDAQHAIVAFDENWHQGVIGILASRLKDKFYRPVIAFAPGDAGLLKGSGRSIPGFHCAMHWIWCPNVIRI